jgi:hypothetical protein
MLFGLMVVFFHPVLPALHAYPMQLMAVTHVNAVAFLHMVLKYFPSLLDSLNHQHWQKRMH